MGYWIPKNMSCIVGLVNREPKGNSSRPLLMHLRNASMGHIHVQLNSHLCSPAIINGHGILFSMNLQNVYILSRPIQLNNSPQHYSPMLLAWSPQCTHSWSLPCICIFHCIHIGAKPIHFRGGSRDGDGNR